MVASAFLPERERIACSPARCPRPSGAATKGTAGSPARAGWRPAHPSPGPPAPVGPPRSRRVATPKRRPTSLAGNLFPRASRSGPTHAAPRPRRRCRLASTSPEARRPLAPTLAVDPAQPSLATAAEPPPIPAPSPPHRVVPQRSTLLLLPRVSPKVAGLRHPNRAPKIDLWGYVQVAMTSPPQKPTYPRKLRTSRPPWVIAVSFGSMRSSQLPVGGERRTPPQQRPLMTIDEAATYLNVPARWV